VAHTLKERNKKRFMKEGGGVLKPCLFYKRNNTSKDILLAFLAQMYISKIPKLSLRNFT
jgi:hypothetical protein